ncbi:MAG: hypothetical protein U1C46_02890 [Bacteroidales bacterium]|nr:hypothetical protein [Bacteroidales bacterium]MDZ4203745.1 hypothetical protein [Bacteroidales bacterium]
MSTKTRSFLLWTLTVLFTLGISYYQRRTGPTKPLRGKVELAGETIRYRLIRTQNTGSAAAVEINAPDTGVKGIYQYRRFKSYDSWLELPMQREGDKLIAAIPSQAPAGKVMYQVWLEKNGQRVQLAEEPVVIRFKGAVPLRWLIPHILFMFLAMLISTRTGLEALVKGNNTLMYAWFTTIFLFIGGIILGPVIQKFAFDAYWTGWPAGKDLTDNKTAVAMILWVIALVRLIRNKENRGWALAAAIVVLLIYLIPHSMLGSELDYTVGG